MMAPPRQLTFRWPHSPSFAREDFLSAPSNHEALTAIERWPNWAGRMLMLVGPEGAGKSHLGAIWARAAGAIALSGQELDEQSVQACARAHAVLIEDADGARRAEALFFHLINTALQNNAWLLLTSRAAADSWGLDIPDLLSRLRLAPVVAPRRAGYRIDRSGSLQAVQRSPARGGAPRHQQYCAENRAVARRRASACRRARQ